MSAKRPSTDVRSARRDSNVVASAAEGLLRVKGCPRSPIPLAGLCGGLAERQMNIARPVREVEDALIEALIERRREALEQLAKW